MPHSYERYAPWVGQNARFVVLSIRMAYLKNHACHLFLMCYSKKAKVMSYQISYLVVFQICKIKRYWGWKVRVGALPHSTLFEYQLPQTPSGDNLFVSISLSFIKLCWTEWSFHDGTVQIILAGSCALVTSHLRQRQVVPQHGTGRAT